MHRDFTKPWLSYLAILSMASAYACSSTQRSKPHSNAPAAADATEVDLQSVPAADDNHVTSPPTPAAGEQTLGGLSGGGGVRSVGLIDSSIRAQSVGHHQYVFVNSGSRRRVLQVSIQTYKEKHDANGSESYDIAETPFPDRLVLMPFTPFKYTASYIDEAGSAGGDRELHFVDAETQADVGTLLYLSDDNLPFTYPFADLKVLSPEWPILQTDSTTKTVTMQLQLLRDRDASVVTYAKFQSQASPPLPTDDVEPMFLPTAPVCDDHCTVKTVDGYITVELKPTVDSATFTLSGPAGKPGHFQKMWIEQVGISGSIGVIAR